MKQSLGRSAAFVSGGTLLRTQWENGVAPMPSALIDLRGVPGLAGMTVSEEDGLVVGALATLSDCRRRPLLAERAPSLAEAVRSIAAPSVRNLGTIGGNVVSGVGDVLPALLAHDAELVWYGGDGAKLSLSEAAADWLERFGEESETRVLTSIRLPRAGRGELFFEAYRKVGRREAFTPSLVTVALRGRLDASGRWTDCRIAAGGGAMKPMRLTAAEAVWSGAAASGIDYGKLYMAAEAEYAGVTDAFADARYRKKTAAGLIASALWEAAQGSRFS